MCLFVSVSVVTGGVEMSLRRVNLLLTQAKLEVYPCVLFYFSNKIHINEWEGGCKLMREKSSTTASVLTLAN